MLRRRKPRSLLPLVRSRGRRRSLPQAWPAAVAAALAGVLAGVAAFLRRRRAAADVTGRKEDRGERHPQATPPGAPPNQAESSTLVHQEWTCQCGQAYRVSGEGRHRIYWLPDAPVSDPITDGRCANCQRELPGEQASEADGDEPEAADDTTPEGAGASEPPAAPAATAGQETEPEPRREPGAAKEPEAGQEPAVAQEPEVGQEPEADQQPAADRRPSGGEPA